MLIYATLTFYILYMKTIDHEVIFFILLHLFCCFSQEHLLRLDPVTNMGFSSDSVFSYHVGDQITRIKGEGRSPLV